MENRKGLKILEGIRDENIPFVMSFTFGEDLHEIPDDTHEMKKGIDFLKRKFELSKNGDIAGLIGGYCKMINEFDESEKFLKIAIEWNEDNNNARGVFRNKIRLANTYQFQKNFEKSNLIFDELESEITKPEFENLKYFLFQHIGKNKYDQKLFDEALSYFKKALELRIEKGDEELIRSTKTAINTTKNRLNL